MKTITFKRTLMGVKQLAGLACRETKDLYLKSDDGVYISCDGRKAKGESSVSFKCNPIKLPEYKLLSLCKEIRGNSYDKKYLYIEINNGGQVNLGLRPYTKA